MKAIEEIQIMLVSELLNYIDKIKSTQRKLDYYNEILGDTSFLLAGLLESLLKKNYNDWDTNKWIDDSLIIKVIIKKDTLTIWGIMIWGIANKTEQWTDPFCFEIEFIKGEIYFKKFTFLFCDLDNHEISFEEFKNQRNYWSVTDRNWKYIINSKNRIFGKKI